MWELGRADDAITGMMEALALDPSSLPIRLEIVGWLLEVGRNVEAFRAAEVAAAALPESATVRELHAAARAALDEELRKLRD